MKVPTLPARGLHPPTFRFFFIVLLLLGLLCISPVSTLSVTGSKYMENLPPGSVALHGIHITAEQGDDPFDLHAEVMGFTNGPDGAYQPLTTKEDTGPYSARRFISLDRTQIRVEPGTSQEIKATITLPQDVGSGGRYAIIYLRSQPREQGQIGFITAVAVPVMITISGTEPLEAGTITGIMTGTIATGQPFTVTTGFQNTGNHHYYRLTDTVVVSDAHGVISTASVGPVPYAIVPGSVVQFKVPVDSPLPVGTYTVQSTVTKEDGTMLDQKSVNFEVAIPFTPPPTSTTITLTPQAEGVLVSPDGRYSVTFPAGSVLSSVDVTLKPVLLDQIPSATEDITIGSSTFVVEGLAGLLAKPATVRVKYSEDDLRAAQGDAGSLKLARFDAGGNTWNVLSTTRDGDTLVARSDRMGTWAVVSAQGGAGIGIDANMLMILGGIIAVVVILLVAFMLKKKKNSP